MDGRYQIGPVIYELVSSVLTAIATYIYVIAKDLYYSNWIFIAIMAALFAYLFKLIIDFILDAIIAGLTKPRILTEIDLANGVPEEHKAAIVYTVYAVNSTEIEIAMKNMEQSFTQNAINTPKDHLVAIYASDTKEPSLILQEIHLIRELQVLYGHDRIYYAHREENWGKKWGHYQDLMKWLYEGKIYPEVYLHEKYKDYRRDPDKPVFSLSSMKNTLGELVTNEEVLTGIVGDIESLYIGDKRKCVKYLLISDADVVWPAGAARKTIAKMAHSSNGGYGIFQPLIRISNSSDSLYTKISSWARELIRFSQLAFWKVHDRCQFYGKGGIKIGLYIEKIMRPGHEVLDPDTLSHDFRESVYLPTVLLADVTIEEGTVTNYFDELERLYRWTIGDLQGIGKEVITRNILAKWCKRSHKPEAANLPPLSLTQRRIMGFIIRLTLGTPLFALWLLGTLLAAILPGLMLTWNRTLEASLYMTTIIGIIGIPKLLAPMTAKIKAPQLRYGKTLIIELMRTLWIGILECVFTTFIFLQFLYDKPLVIWHALAALYRSRRGQPLTWKPMHHTSKPTTIIQVYSKRAIPTLIGIAFLMLLIITASDVAGILRWLPVWGSFLIGPIIVWYTGRRKPG